MLRSGTGAPACLAWSVASYFSTGGLVWSVNHSRNHYTGVRARPGLVGL